MPTKFHAYAVCIGKKSSRTLLVLGLVVVIYMAWTFVSVRRTVRELNMEQTVVDYIAENLQVNVKAGDTMTTARSVSITLSNTGNKDITFGQWRIYFYSSSPSRTNKAAGFNVGWINGGLYFLSPIESEFEGISAGSSVRLVLQEWKSCARYDHFPNWYVASTEYGVSTPRIIESTKDESLSYVSPFENSFQWKKHEFDLYNPYTPYERYLMNSGMKNVPIKPGKNVIPTPVSVETSHQNKTIDFDGSWVVVKQESNDQKHVRVSLLLARKLGLKEIAQPTRQRKCIKFETDKSLRKEQYKLKVDTTKEIIVITSDSREGAFYGVQTLLSILESSRILPQLLIKDHPRFSYRGLMIDVARNFQNKKAIKKVIDVMSLYKMNKLHLHLTDDDGWRIEIPTIPELTKYGSRRCNYFKEEKCLIPSLGSGPYSRQDFYTVGDFREILRYAKDRYVEVIPEIDVPGHALSAVKTMQLREQDLQKNANKRSSYILSDDESGIPSIQGWMGNSINPCLNATYRFLETILTDLKLIYQGIQDLKLVHIGGDEVPNGVWEHSKTCKSLFHDSSLRHSTIKKMFLFTAADIAHKLGLKISIWEDGAYQKQKGPYDAREFRQDVFVNAWNNVWEWGVGGRAIEFADAGYKVILSMATHLYFDHPYEPDPEERGLYWATRYIDTYKVFGLMPMDVYSNADFDSVGNRIDTDVLCKGPCPQTRSPNNYVGLEACVWSETIRNEDHLFTMIFPRLLALAERAWHEADWERLNVFEERERAKRKDFDRFINILGKSELPRFEKANIPYRIPPPGLTFSKDTRMAKVNTFYSGHNVMVSLGNGSSWDKMFGTEIEIPHGVSDIHVYAVSPFSNRKSRTVSLHVTNGVAYIYSYTRYVYTFVLLSVSVIV